MSDLDAQAVAPWWSSQTTTVPDSQQQSETRGAFAAVVAFTVILLISPQNWFPFLKPFRIAFLAAGLGVGSLLWERWRSRQPFGVSREILFCIALLIWAFLTLPLSYWMAGSMATLTDLYLKAVIVFWLLANVVTTESRLHLLAIVLMLCTIVLAGTAVKNFLTGNFLSQRITGYESMLASNPNDLALMLNLLIPLGIALLLGAETHSSRFFWAAMVGMNVLAVIVTFSRAGFLALATIGLVYFARLVRRRGSDRRWAFAMVTLAILALPLLPSTYVDRLATVTNMQADTTGSAQNRWRDAVAAMHYISDHPIIGAGIGMDALALNEVRGAWWTQVHNVYLQYGVDLGLPGAILFVLLLYGVFKATRTSARRLADDPERRNLFLMAEATQVSVMVFVVASFFHPVAYHFYFYYIAGLALGVRATVEGEMERRQPGGTERRQPAVAVAEVHRLAAGAPTERRQLAGTDRRQPAVAVAEVHRLAAGAPTERRQLAGTDRRQPAVDELRGQAARATGRLAAGAPDGVLP